MGKFCEGIWIRICEGMLKERPGIGNERQVVCIATSVYRDKNVSRY